MKKSYVYLILVFACLSLTSVGFAQNKSLDKQELILAYLYNFAKFVSWPEQVDRDSVQFCFYGKEKTIRSYESIEGKSVGQAQIQVHKLDRGEDVTACHVLFIEVSEEIYLSPLLALTQGEPILTVSMINGFAGLGGCIGLVEQEKKLRFEINKAVIDHANLKLSSKLYKLAILVLDR